jgi:predicted MFS family arabinose efflux permease
VHGVALSTVRPGLGALVARTSRVSIVVASFILLGAGLGLAAVSRSMPASLAVAGLTGIGVGFLFPLTMVLVTHEAARERVARLLGLRFAIVTAGAMLGPALICVVATESLPAAMAVTAGICTVGGMWALWIGRHGFLDTRKSPMIGFGS